MDVAERSRIVERYRAHSRRFDGIAARRAPRGAPIGLLPKPPAESLAALSTREIEVLQLVADGLTTGEIGKRLFLAADTVKSYVKHLLSKLEAHSRAGAVGVGLRRGLIK